MSPTITIRLSDRQHERYSALAAKAGIGLSTYLRQQLEGAEDLSRQLSDLRLEVAAIRRGDCASPVGVVEKLDGIIGQLQAGSMAQAGESAIDGRNTQATPSTPALPGWISDSQHLLECLLLLRFSLGPEARAKASGELERHGLKAWSPRKRELTTAAQAA